METVGHNGASTWSALISDLGKDDDDETCGTYLLHSAQDSAPRRRCLAGSRTGLPGMAPAVMAAVESTKGDDVLIERV